MADTVGRLRPSIVRDLGLRGHGLTLVAPDVRVFAPQPDGRAITLWTDVAATADGLRAWSDRDAERYAGFDRLVRSIGRFLAELNAATPPDVRSPGVGDALAGLRLGRRFRGLGKRDSRAVLRVLPMAIADFVAESFETDALQGVLATRGIQNTAMGPWSAGTTNVFRPTRPATTAAQPARRSTPAAVRGRFRRRWLLRSDRPAVRSGPMPRSSRSGPSRAARSGSSWRRARRSARPSSSPGRIRSGS